MVANDTKVMANDTKNPVPGRMKMEGDGVTEATTAAEQSHFPNPMAITENENWRGKGVASLVLV